MLSRICEEFGCTPSQALKEPAELVLTIMQDRGFVEAKRAVERAQSEDDATEWQKAVVFEVIAEITRRRAQG